MFKREVLKVRKYKVGYEVRTELVDLENGDPKTEMRSAYTSSGDYIGDPKTAYFLYRKMGLSDVQSRAEGSGVAQIGFNKEEQKWYGWSHRAICGFGIGNRIFEEGYGDEHTPFIECGRETIENMQHAKIAASNFAASVS
jgi:hypothetical protein